MDTGALTDDDEALVERLLETNDRTVDVDFLGGAHIVAAGIRTNDDTVYEGVSLPANIGRASVCAEPVAIGSAIADGYSHDELQTCVAVAYPMPHHDSADTRAVPPCGVCREMLADYNEDMRVIVPVDGENRVARAIDLLLPTRTW